MGRDDRKTSYAPGGAAAGVNSHPRSRSAVMPWSGIGSAADALRGQTGEDDEGHGSAARPRARHRSIVRGCRGAAGMRKSDRPCP